MRIVILAALALLALAPVRGQGTNPRHREAEQDLIKAVGLLKDAKGSHDPEIGILLFQRTLEVYRKIGINDPKFYPRIINSRIRYCESAIKQLTEAAEALRQKPGVATKELALENTRLKAELAKLRERTQPATRALEEAQQLALENRKLRSEIAILKLRQPIATPSQTTTQLMQELIGTQRTLFSERVKHTNRILALETQIKKLQNEVSDAKTTAKVKTDTALKFANEAGAAKEREQKAKQERIAATARLEKTQQKLAATKKDLAIIQAEKTKLAEAVAALKNGKSDELTKHLTQLHIALVKSRQELRDQKVLVRLEELRTREVQKDLDVLQAANADLRKALKARNLHADAAIIGELEDLLEIATGKYRKTESERREIEAQLNVQTELNRRLYSEINAQGSQTDTRKLRETLAEREDEVKRLRELSNGLKQRAARAETAIIVNKKLHDELLAKCNELQAELDSQKDEVTLMANSGNAAEANILAQQGNAAVRLRQNTKAEKLFREALKHNSACLDALRGLGSILAEKANPSAVEILERAHQIAPRDKPIRSLLIKTCVNTKRPHTAIAVLLGDLGKTPKDPEVRLLAARLARRQGWSNLAASILQPALGIAKPSLELACEAALFFASQAPSHMQEAKSWYSKAQKLGAGKNDVFQKEWQQLTTKTIKERN